jgi:hypothetical protein
LITNQAYRFHFNYHKQEPKDFGIENPPRADAEDNPGVLDPDSLSTRPKEPICTGPSMNTPQAPMVKRVAAIRGDEASQKRRKQVAYLTVLGFLCTQAEIVQIHDNAWVRVTPNRRGSQLTVIHGLPNHVRNYNQSLRDHSQHRNPWSASAQVSAQIAPAERTHQRPDETRFPLISTFDGADLDDRRRPVANPASTAINDCQIAVLPDVADAATRRTMARRPIIEQSDNPQVSEPVSNLDTTHASRVIASHVVEQSPSHFDLQAEKGVDIVAQPQVCPEPHTEFENGSSTIQPQTLPESPAEIGLDSVVRPDSPIDLPDFRVHSETQKVSRSQASLIPFTKTDTTAASELSPNIPGLPVHEENESRNKCPSCPTASTQHETITSNSLTLPGPHLPTVPTATSGSPDTTKSTDASTNIELELYLGDKADPNPAESEGWLMLTDMTDREKLFAMTKDDLQASGYLDADDVITAFRFEHADGLIPGTGKSSRWIKSSGGPDMWKLTLKKMTLSKA